MILNIKISLKRIPGRIPIYRNLILILIYNSLYQNCYTNKCQKKQQEQCHPLISIYTTIYNGWN